jgi:hypothetical protein
MAVVMNSRGPLFLALSQLIKEIIWHFLSIKRKTSVVKRDIFLFASRRSGSTLLMQAFGSQQGVRFIDQPFSIYTNSKYGINHLPIFDGGQLIDMNADERREVFNYVEKILKGDLIINGPWKFWEKGFSLFWDRSILKITDAKCIIGTLLENFDADSIVLLRHPVSQALSVERNKWSYTGKSFLRSEYYCKKFLSTKQLDFAREIYNSEGSLEKRVMDWCLENIPLITYRNDNKAIHLVFFEHLITDSNMVFNDLAANITISNREAFVKLLTKPSRSTKLSSTNETISKIKSNNKTFLIDNWLSKLNAEQFMSIQNILDVMNIKIYLADDPMPAEFCLNRNELAI